MQQPKNKASIPFRQKGSEAVPPPRLMPKMSVSYHIETDIFGIKTYK